ncbi:7-cyano-7-deazaguanine synthase [Lignipirellula cremea]|uniref:7-cyano-7-deazaguanine synthase n=1 Tax=Lignipirellula cremea TaxID=2528010 RepID=A0A518DVJ1_9BACT|nr:7-cyano-7-deazaguanine synthase [Lignipirellula cremea]QDU95856.1 7-cyano-7-deazaguanine synthase [Lignipirellula cremea]
MKHGDSGRRRDQLQGKCLMNLFSTGILLSGGLDSCILLAQLLDQGRTVQPFYVRSDLGWEVCELASIRKFLAAFACPRLLPLVELAMPVKDLYGDHWSISGEDAPGYDSADTDVFLPGRNALLAIKAALWCQLHALPELHLATLKGNPFADASDAFFDHFHGVLDRTGDARVRIVRPFAQLSKCEVMRLGSRYPLEFTFSCIAPRQCLHCGACNKCSERQKAFADLGFDPTRYALATNR